MVELKSNDGILIMKKLLFVLWAAFCLFACGEKPTSVNPKFRFNENGKFKIAQLTDIHIHPGDVKSESVPDTILAVLAKEKPDLVIMTGDIVTRKPALQGWKLIMDMMKKANIPYAVTMGNHDPEAMDRDSIYDLLMTDPLFVGEKGPQELSGVGNFILPIGASDGSNQIKSLIYCLDSGDYPDIAETGSYAWIQWNQIAWYRQQSEEYTRMNGGQPIPSLAFFHIAVPEYRNINEENANVYGCNKEGSGVGAPDLNSGFLVSCLEKGDVMGIFVGHDHDDDYIGLQNKIALAYGRVSGFNAYGDLTRGARIIELTEDKRQFDTWISTPIGNELQYQYPWGFTGEDLQQVPLSAKQVSPSKQGVSYTYYEGSYKKMEDFPQEGKKVQEGTQKNFSVKNAPSEDHFGYEFKSYIQIPETEIYIFKLSSDDGAQLFIDGQLVVDNGKAHSSSNFAKGKISLAKGYHELRIAYYENYMGEDLKVTIESRNMEEQSIPDEMLFIP